MDATEVAQELERRARAFAWGEVAGVGAAAYLLGYLVTTVIVYVGPSNTQGNLRGILTLIAFVFYSAQNIPALVPSLGSIYWLQYVARPDTATPATPPVVFYLVPVVVVLATGAWAVYRFGDRDGHPVEALLTAVAFAVGYWVLVVAGTFVFQTTSNFGVRSRIVLEEAAIYGFVYPLVVSLLAATVVQFGRYLRAEPA